jgi:hypothetical protein
MSGSRETTAAGGLVSISANFLALYERAAPYVDKIIKGANPANLPVEQPTKFQVVINMKTAQSLGQIRSERNLGQLLIGPLCSAQMKRLETTSVVGSCKSSGERSKGSWRRRQDV